MNVLQGLLVVLFIVAIVRGIAWFVQGSSGGGDSDMGSHSHTGAPFDDVTDEADDPDDGPGDGPDGDGDGSGEGDD